MAKAPAKKPAPKKAASSNLPATAHSSAIVEGDYDEFERFAGGGLQNVTSRDLLIPRLTILQALSPQVNQRKPEYIDGAKSGDICDVGTQELFEAPLTVLPVIFVKQWIEWAPRGSGGGLVRIHNTPDILQYAQRDKEGAGPFLDNGNLIQETAQFYCLNLSAMGRRSFIPMASTQLKVARGWLTKVQTEKIVRADGTYWTPPFYFRVYELSVVEASNAKGDWFTWRVEKGQPIKGDNQHEPIEGWQSLLQEAVAFEKSILAGEARGDVASMGEEQQGGGGSRSRAADEDEAM